MKVHLVQFAPEWENKEANFFKVQKLLRQNKPEPNSLIILPEAFATGFSLNLSKTLHYEPRETSTFLSKLSSEYKTWVLAGTIAPDKDQELGKNLSVLFNPSGECVGEYQKMHPFTLLGEEKAHLPGKKYELFKIGDFMLCPILCYDLRFPELFRHGAQQGANLFAVLASWPNARMNHWHTLLQARAIENQAYVIGINRTGRDPNYKYAGGSKIIGPKGLTIAQANEEEQVLQATLTYGDVVNWRSSFPALSDIREDLIQSPKN